jgi:hypothetical protein
MQAEPLTIEIAATAARLIAEEGLDYASAKQKALKQMGLAKARVSLPPNELVEEELRQYQAEFQSDFQPLELLRLRQVALRWMLRLADYQPQLTGAAWSGTGSTHSAVHLLLITDDEKLLEIELLNREIPFDVAELKHLDGRGMVPALVLQDEDIPVVLALYPERSIPPKNRGGRTRYANTAAVEALLAQTHIKSTQ